MLAKFIDWLFYSALRLEAESLLVRSLNFFVYDSVKILLLLFVMIAVIGFFRTFLAGGKIKKWLLKKGWYANLFAAVFGAITPFCSCSSIPIFFGFMEAGIPLGAAFSFLITSPLINEYLVVLMLGFFGAKITAAYILCGLIIGVGCGLILGKLNLEKYLIKNLITPEEEILEQKKYKGLHARLKFGLNEAVSIVRAIWLWVLVGVAIGAWIHNYIPQREIEMVIDKAGIFSVPIAAAIGVPLYGSCAAIVPIAVVLFQKGVPLGTALAFMMAIAALSLPEAVILKRAMRLKLLVAFFLITTFGIILIGYLFNFLQKVLV